MFQKVPVIIIMRFGELLKCGPTARNRVVPYLLRKLVDYKHYVQYVQWYCREGRAAGEQSPWMLSLELFGSVCAVAADYLQTRYRS